MIDLRELLADVPSTDFGDDEAVEAPPFSFPRSPSRPVHLRTRRTHRTSRRTRPVRPTLPDSIPLFAWLGRRFAPGEATVWVGPSRALDALLELLYAGNALVRGRISLIEGANRFHPYRIGEWGRALGADPSDVLERIRLARAFTAYQLVALVDAWGREARQHAPSLLVAHELPALFFTEEVPEEERAPLLRHVAATLAELAHAVDVPLLLTLEGGWSRFPGLADAGPRCFDYVTISPRRESFHLRAYRDDARLALVSRPPGQLGLDEYDPNPREEVTGWAVPRPRTARRSRSG